MALYTSVEQKQNKKHTKLINNSASEELYNNSLKKMNASLSYEQGEFSELSTPLRKRLSMRKNIKKQQASRIKFLAIFFIIFSIIMPTVFFENYGNLFLNKIANRNIQIPNDLSFLNQAEYSIADNGNFLDTKFIDDVNTQNPLMKLPVLKGKMYYLTNQLKYLASTYPQLEAGIFIWDYNTGRYVDINGDQVFPTASIIKLPIMFQVFRRAEKGLINLNDKITLTDYYVSAGSGFLQYSPLGRRLTYRELANLMIQESDNTATNMLLSSVGGMNELDREIKKWGLKATSMENWLPDLNGTNVSTPKELGTLLYNIGNTDLLSIKTRAEIIDIMSHVRNRNLIQAGLPDNVVFVHKTGDIGRMLGDAGIVALPDGRKYIIAIMVKRPWNSFSAKEFIIAASKVTYNSYVTQGQ